MINFWATWCVPCRVEMPELQAFHEAHPAVRVLAVNLGESRDLIVDWVTQFGLTFDIVLDTDRSIADLYRLRGQPSTYRRFARRRDHEHLLRTDHPAVARSRT